MNCSSCGTQLPPGAANCPMCGALTPYYYSSTGVSPSDPTVASSAPNFPSTSPRYEPTIAATPYNTPQVPPPTSYGSAPYRNPQAPPSPYAVPPTSPYGPMTPPPYQRPRKNRALTIGIVILVLILVGAGTFGLLALLVKNNPQGKTTGTPTTTTRTTQVNTAATATAQVSQNPYSSNPSTLALIDPLQDNSRGYKWDEATLGGSGTCGFSGGAYHMTAPQPPGIICDPEAPQLTLSDLTFEAKVTVLQGDGASLVFRLSQAKGTGYYFDIDTQGNYEILAADANNHTRTLRSGSNSAIKKGTNQTNLVAVVAIGNSISVYVNNQFIDKATDSSYTQGQIGIGCFTNKGSADVAAIDAKVWKM